MTIQELRNSIERKKGMKEQKERDLEIASKTLLTLKESLYQHEQAREIIIEAGLKTQRQLQYQISDIASLALNTIFDDPYELKADFIHRRNKTECDLLFTRNGNDIEPLESSGVGAIDIASFALRIASWIMKKPRSRNTIILDEPMRYLSANYQERASLLIKEISDKLGVQIIMVTHEEQLTTAADKIFNVKIKNGISDVNCIISEKL